MGNRTGRAASPDARIFLRLIAMHRVAFGKGIGVIGMDMYWPCATDFRSLAAPEDGARAKPPSPARRASQDGFRFDRIVSQDGRRVMLRPRMTTPLLVFALQDGDEPSAMDGHAMPPGTAILIAHDTPSVLTVGAGGEVIVIHIPRARLQAAASARLGEPRRLGMTEVRLAPPARGAMLEDAILLVEDRSPRHAAELLGALMDRLMEQPDSGNLFPVARSVKAAMDYVRDNIDEDCGPDRLAAVAGVTTAWLRQNFRACLGLSIAGYVHGVRLDIARERLLGGRESRSIAAIAFACGFQTANAFSRAYTARFGEAPSATRARTV
jgi:AraC-like DNA-binding protein